MASFGEDVSMADFRPTHQDEDPDAAVSHTSGGSVLNVQIAAAVPPRTEQSVAVAAAGGEFRTSLPSARRDKSPSQSQIDKAKQARAYLETKYKNLNQESQEREESLRRIQILNARMDQMDIAESEREKYRQHVWQETAMATTRATTKGHNVNATTISGARSPTKPPAPITTLDSATTSPVATLAIRATSGPGAARTRGQRPTSPVASVLCPPAHMTFLGPLWATMTADLQQQLSHIPVAAIKANVKEAEDNADRHATELAQAAHQDHMDALEQTATGIDARMYKLRASAAADSAQARELEPQARMAHAAITAANREHSRLTHSFTPAAADTPMPPPPPRQNTTAAAATSARPTQANSYAEVTYRNQPTLPRNHPAPLRYTEQTPITDEYLDVRVSSLRFHNENFPADLQDRLHDLSVAVTSALTTIHHGKAHLRLARDIATSSRILFSPDIIDKTLTLCDAVRWAYNSGKDRPWFAKNIHHNQEAAGRKPFRRTNSTTSDSSVEVLRQRPREDPSSGRGKSKRVTTALTSDSDSGSETFHGHDRDSRHLGKS